MKVSIVVPNYNGKKLLEKNLQKVIKTSNKSEIIVVDDGSSDDSAEFLAKNFPTVEVIRKPRNDGFASTVNTGVAAAKGDVVVLLNTDAVPHGGFLRPLLSHFKDKMLFAVGCMDESIEGKVVIKRGRGVGSFKRGFLVHKRGEVDKGDTLWVNGGSGAFRKSIWKELGGMDELYNPFYWEDIDLSYRAQKAGYKVIFEPKSIVEHRHTEGSISKYYSQSDVQKVSYRNQFFFVWKNITDWKYIFQHMLWLPYHFVAALFRKDTVFFAGFTAALIQLPKVLYKHIRLQTLWKKSDAQIFSQF